MRIFEQNPIFNIEQNQLLHQQFLVLYPQLSENEFNHIIQNLVDCLSSSFSIFKIVPLTIRQIGVESMVQGKQRTFYFQLSNIEKKAYFGLFWERNYRVEFDIDKCFIAE